MFKFDMYLLMARCYGDNSAPLTADPAPVTNPKKRKKKKLMQEAAQQVRVGIDSGLRWLCLVCRHMLAGAALQQRECQLPCTDCNARVAGTVVVLAARGRVLPSALHSVLFLCGAHLWQQAWRGGL